VNVSGTNTATALVPGYTLDRYELLCPLAEGGMASVWVARLQGKHGFEKLVAIKTILPRFASDRRFRDMFLDEARIAARIEHPNVAQVFDLGEKQDVLYLVMEYVDGDSLSKLNRACQRKGVKIPIGVVLRVLADACAGLHEAHELKDAAGKLLGTVHRDVSPHNILVSTKGTAKLIDFGIAKIESREGEDTGSGVLKGKIQYMAPEQALGQPVDRRADVWGVGAILYHLLAGRAPYEGENQLATLHLLGAGLPPPPLASDVHPAVAAVARKALAHDASNRYATAADLREAIERAMAAAQLMTTSADVAAFSGEHVAERAQRRRAAIEQALAASAERLRVDSLRAVAARATDPNPAAASFGAASHDDALGPRAMSPALVSEPPAAGGSYATLGSAALNASHTLHDAPKASRHTPTVLGFLFGFTVVMGASIAVLHPRRLIGGGHTSASGRTKAATAWIASSAPAPPLPPPPPSPSASPVHVTAPGTASGSSAAGAASGLPAADGPVSPWIAPDRRVPK
jgi:predicted Ser/Thr protein kinase